MQVNIKESATNSMLLEIIDEGHTIGNLIRSALTENPSVDTAAYKVIHPLKNIMEISFKTYKEKPAKVLKDVLEEIIGLTTKVKKQFLKSLNTK
ncbi:MAG: RpoL/Rpb11 RNA polymerase subunit family protein [Candidatus Ranarchaeia archaeon]